MVTYTSIILKVMRVDYALFCKVVRGRNTMMNEMILDDKHPRTCDCRWCMKGITEPRRLFE